MIVGCVKEVKNSENRVGLMPSHALEYIRNGHHVLVEKGCGVMSGFNDAMYQDVGCELIDDAKTVWDRSDMVIKVKEPVESEYDLLKPDGILFTYLHLADNRRLTEVLLEKRVSAVAYETVTDENGYLPLLKPMSEVAGRLAIKEGEKFLQGHFGGKGILLSGVTGVRRGHVVIIGSGVAGLNAAKAALGSGATVSMLGRDMNRLSYIEDIFDGRVTTLFSDETNLINELKKADIVVGSVLVPGDKTPRIVRREHMKYMEKGTVLIDISIDQGGCFETSRPTSHKEPIYIEEGMVHYCVTNMPGAVPKTSTFALGNATLPIGITIANLGLHEAVLNHEGIRMGLNTFASNVCNEAVGRAVGLPFKVYENCVKVVKS